MSDPLVTAGKLFCFAEGEYSDYGYVGHFLALQDIDAELIATIKRRCLDRIKNGEITDHGGTITDVENEEQVSHAMSQLFLPELIRSGAVMDIDCTEIHLKSYGKLLI